MTVALGSKFGVYDWKRLSEACYEDELVIDLSNVEFAYPPGIVALCLAVNYRSQKGKPTELALPEAPEEDDVVAYLNRIDLFDSLPRETRIYQNLSSLEQHARNPSHEFTEVLVLDQEGIEDANIVVQRFLQSHVKHWRKPYGVFNEVLLNARDHSSVSEVPKDDGAETELGFGALHVQAYKDRLELAVGDIGVGIRKSLNTCPNYDFRRSTRAIWAALEKGASRFSHVGDCERGGGLRRVKDVIEEVDGELDLRSYGGSAHLANGSVKYDGHPNPFPGTLARVKLPSRDHE